MKISPIRLEGVDLPIPSVFTPNWEDVSKATAGRTEDAIMHPQKIGTARTFTMEWNNISFDKADTILKAFAPYRHGESFNATVFDLELGEKSNNWFITREFYVGGRTAPIYNMTLELASVSFKIISIGVD